MLPPVTAVPQMSAAALSAAGRVPETPFVLPLSDERVLRVERLLRVLPAKRVVGLGVWMGQWVLVKCFIAKDAHRHWQRERQGIQALLSAGIPTPDIVYSGPLYGGGFVLLTRFLPQAKSLGEVWKTILPSPSAQSVLAAKACLRPAFQALARMHAAGLVQTDLHLDNFLLDEDSSCYVIDGDAVRRQRAGALTRAEALDNLAVLLAQFLPPWDEHWPLFLAMYGWDAATVHDALASLRQAVAKVRAWRLRDYLRKSVRDCSLFAARNEAGRFVSVVRSELSFLDALLESPDAFVTAGYIYKDGGACTVSRIDYQGRTLVIKRYNIKDWPHAVSRCWRPTRAWHSWLAAHRLIFWGVATPQPLAVIEERKGFFRGRAFFITAYCPGSSLFDCLDPNSLPDTAQQAAILRLFGLLKRLRITHGDLKAYNLFWHEGEIVLIDLDALTQHHSDWAFKRAWAADRKRFLRNWPAASVLSRWLDAQLPTV